MSTDIMYPEEIRCNYFERINKKRCICAEEILSVAERIDNLTQRAALVREVAAEIFADIQKQVSAGGLR